VGGRTAREVVHSAYPLLALAHKRNRGIAAGSDWDGPYRHVRQNLLVRWSQKTDRGQSHDGQQTMQTCPGEPTQQARIIASEDSAFDGQDTPPTLDQLQRNALAGADAPGAAEWRVLP
jgi:hypothetical protein